jgi:micrococcal nuclease
VRSVPARSAVLLFVACIAACSAMTDPAPVPTGVTGGATGGVGASGPDGPSGAGDAPGRPAVVTRVVDGDTIHADLRGRDLNVRLIGIDTPEVDPSIGVECFGDEASRFTERMLGRRSVRLELDVERHDRYGRVLAYVWLDGELFNERLVRTGHAVVTTYPPNVKYVERFMAAQTAARDAGRGLWGACPVAPPQPVVGQTCDPSYPDVCIPSAPPDLDCADVVFRFFVVRPPDPHGFDGNQDGVGCEIP